MCVLVGAYMRVFIRKGHPIYRHKMRVRVAGCQFRLALLCPATFLGARSTRSQGQPTSVLLEEAPLLMLMGARCSAEV